MTTFAPDQIDVIEHFVIPMRDGRKLSARVWKPVTTKPLPVVLEYIPYRKRDVTRYRDEPMHGYFAQAGYVAVRLDLAGSGDSAGVLTDEYAVQEQDDAVEAIDWLSRQPWCSGAVGMIGKSWGGFNCLQIAARRPPALRAIIPVAATDDRYADDLHFLGGCLMVDGLDWGAVLQTFLPRPPDPALVGAGWRAIWQERLDRLTCPLETWLTHQRRDHYWRHGSICEDYGAITAATLLVGGWVDGYRTALLRMSERLSCPVKCIMGPWAHVYPHDGVPGPQIGFLQEAVRWFEHFLRGGESDVMGVARLVAGVLLAFVVSGLGGLLGGAIGGWSLPALGQGKNRWGYAWRSGITFGAGYGLLLFPVILIVSLLSYYEVGYTPVFVFGLIFGVVGLIFGSIMGASLGLWTVGRHFRPITGWSASGFGLGGVFLGASIWYFIFNLEQGLVSFGPYGWLLAGLFIFAGLGGLGVATAYQRLEMQVEHVLTPVRALTQQDWWQRWSIAAAVLLLLAILFRPVISTLGDVLTPIDAGLSAVLDLPTTGTRWLGTESLTAVSPQSPPALAANSHGQLVLTWVQGDTLWLQEGHWLPAERLVAWQPAVSVATGSLADRAVALSENGRSYLSGLANDAIAVIQRQ